MDIKAILKQKDWRIANLARVAGISYPTAHEATKGDWPTDRVTWGTIRKIAKALDLQVTDLLPSDFNGNK